MSTSQPGRRAASRRSEPGGRTRRTDPTTVAAVVLVVLVAAVLAAVRPDAATRASRPAERVPLTQAAVVCPSALDGRQGTDTTLAVATASESAGTLTLTAGTEETSAEVAPGRVASEPARDEPVVASGTGDLAPGIVAGLASSDPLTVHDCRPAAAEQWFTGVGAGPTHASVLELVNPNAGPAVVDVELLGEEGPVEAGALRGIAVPGRSSQQIDLGQAVPRTGVLALHATVVRGQLGIAVRDRGERLTGGVTTEDWLPAQAAPARSSLLLGVRPGGGRHTLAVANPGDDEVRATLRLLTPESAFTPEGLEPVVVPPHSVVQTVLDEVLASDVASDAVGVVVDAPAPVVSTLRSVVDGDLAMIAPGDRVAEATTALLPEGAKTLVLGGADAVGVATVVATTAEGTPVLEDRVSLAPDQGATVDLPVEAASVTVTPRRTGLQGAVRFTDGGLAVVALRELVRTGALPDVGPGLP